MGNKITWPLVVVVAVIIICSTVITVFTDADRAAYVVPLFLGLLAPTVTSAINAKQTSEVSNKVDRVLNGEMEAKIAGVVQDHVPGIVRGELTNMLDARLAEPTQDNDSVTPPSAS